MKSSSSGMVVQQHKHNSNSLHSNNRLASTDCDDGDYDLDERGGGGGNNNNNNNNNNDDDVDDDDILLRGIMEGGSDDDDDGAARSSSSSEGQYRDRNSDPGVDVQNHDDADYLLTPPGIATTVMTTSYNHHQSGNHHNDNGNNNNNSSSLQQLTNMMGHGQTQTSNLHSVAVGGGGGGNTNINNTTTKYTDENSMALGHHRHPAAAGAAMGGAGGGNESVSLGTATQTHEVRMPMLLSTFKPATGCTNASDFIVRCFVARLRSGITVVKHGRRRWCKSRLRILHVHTDGRSLSWKPALGEPSSGKAPPKLDLATCMEVRHAWSPDPDNPMFTGTPILRQKCEAANAHKSFALIFPKRTVDITAVTADQCKVLMEGFSALCFRLLVAQNMSRSGNPTSTNTAAVGGDGKGGTSGTGGGDEDKAATESVTLTNPSLQQIQDSPKNKAKKGVGKRMSFR
jgi:hypothetical protein